MKCCFLKEVADPVDLDTGEIQIDVPLIIAAGGDNSNRFVVRGHLFVCITRGISLSTVTSGIRISLKHQFLPDCFDFT